VERILPAIEKFWRYDGRDDAERRRPGWLTRLDLPLPEAGGGVGAVVADLAEVVIPNGARVSEPGWSGFVTTGPTTAAVAAWLAAAAAASQRYAVQAFNTLERVALDWVAQLCGIPAAHQGVLSSGGSTANLVALGAARQWAFERRGLDVSQDGLPPGARARVYASEQAHHTIQRATAVLGLGRAGTRHIACDARQRIDVAALRAAIAEDERHGVVPVAVVGTAGTTDTGAIDPLGDLAEVAREHGAWFHIDSAYGLIAAASPTLRPAFAAVAHADSVIVDPHKWLATGVGCAATYVRDAGLLLRAFAQGAAAYLEGSFSSEEDDAVVQFDSIGIFPHPFYPQPVTDELCRFNVPVQLADSDGFSLAENGFITRKRWPWTDGYFLPVDHQAQTALVVLQKHPLLGLVAGSCSYVPAFMPIWGNHTTFSWEPFFERTLGPGQGASWWVDYDF